MFTFTIGGMTGVLLAVPPADFVLHNSLFLVAHFHNVIIGGVVFGMFAGINYWFPKAFGFKLDPFLGQGERSGSWVSGLLLRVHAALCSRPDGRHPPVAPPSTIPSLQIWFEIAAFGAFLIAIGIAALPHADLRQHPRPQHGSRLRDDDRRSLERPHARMGDLVAAARL